MHLTGKQPTFRRQRPRSNPNRVLILLGFLIAALFLLRGLNQETIVSPFAPTPIPTRTANSFAMEAESQFTAGNLNKAIEAYQQALELDPANADLWAELARIQTYSSAVLTTDADKKQRLQEALESINKGVEADTYNSNAHAVRSFVLDWNSNPTLAGDQAAALITEAEQEAVRALQLDPQNPLALAYYSEILVDQQKWLQATQYIEQALQRGPDVMDVHRVNAYVQETLANYSGAIEEYKKAVQINPNLTFLYISIGTNYRQLQQYDLALDYYARAANINEQLGINDPLPYMAIGNTYSQTGDFYIAGRNILKALQYNDTNPDVYGSLGMVYYKARNYEGSIDVLKCAVRGCTAEESCKILNGEDCTASQIAESIPVEGMPLSGSTVVYYYTYGSALAGLARPYNDNCTEAMDVFRTIRSQFSTDDLIMQIISTSEEICASMTPNS